MSFPDYVNKIINSHLKNKEIESVRAEITKLISTNKHRRENEEMTEPPKMQPIPKTMTNFFNVHSLSHHKDIRFEPRKTFSQMNINRLKHKLTLQDQHRPTLQDQHKNGIEAPEPEQPAMSQWRLEMLNHLKLPPNNQRTPPIKHERLTIQCENSQEELKSLQEKRKLKLTKTSTSSPALRRFERKPRITQEVNFLQASPFSQKNIILIRPHPVVEEEEDNGNNKLKKTVAKKNKQRKNEVEVDELNFQRLVNLTALLPFLGAQKAKVEARQQKKQRIEVREAVPLPEKLISLQHERGKKVAAEEIEISGWDINHD